MRIFLDANQLFSGARITQLVELTRNQHDFGPWMNRPQDTGGVRVMMVAELLAEWAGI
jgi:hypothetical protein